MDVDVDTEERGSIGRGKIEEDLEREKGADTELGTDVETEVDTDVIGFIAVVVVVVDER